MIVMVRVFRDWGEVGKKQAAILDARGHAAPHLLYSTMYKDGAAIVEVMAGNELYYLQEDDTFKPLRIGDGGIMIKVYGSSDDLIEIEGNITKEFDASYDKDVNDYLFFSDGTVLKIVYGEDDKPFWNIRVLVQGECILNHKKATDEDSDYSDVVTINGNIKWLGYGHSLVY